MIESNRRSIPRSGERTRVRLSVVHQLALSGELGTVRVGTADHRHLIIGLRAQGYGPTAIARHFNAVGIATPSGRGRWHPETVIRHADPDYRQRNAAYMRTYRARRA